MHRLTRLFICLLLFLTANVSFAEFVFMEVDPNEAESIPGVTSESEISAPIEILVTATGDVTLGGNMKHSPKETSYTKQLAKHNDDLSYFFQNVRQFFETDDITLVNFEGTLTNIQKPANDHSFVFRAPPEHIAVLTSSSVEAVALENNHVWDYGQKGYDDTAATLDANNIVYSNDGKMGVYETKGVSIAMLSYQTFDGRYPRLFEQVPREVEAAKEQHDIVIVSFHWGAEKEYEPNENQIKLGRLTVDAGADLVLGHHAHRLNSIESYNGTNIVYSLGNFCFSGNDRPDDMDTFLYQQKFIVTSEGTTHGEFRVIPASISSVTGESGAERGENDFCPTPFAEGSEAAQRVLDKMVKYAKKLTYGIDFYPTQWQ